MANHWRRTDAIVTIELFVIKPGGHFLVRGQAGPANAIQGSIFVKDKANCTCVVGNIFKVELIHKGDQIFTATLEFNNDDTVGAHQAKTAWIIVSRIADRLHPGVFIGNQIAIVVETSTYVAQIVPDAFKHGRITRINGRIARRCYRIPTQHFANRIFVNIRHFVIAIGPNFIGSSGNFVAHGGPCRLVRHQWRAGINGRCPHIIFQPQIIIWFNATRYRITVIIQARIAQYPILCLASARGQGAHVTPGILCTSSTPFMHQGKGPRQTRMRTRGVNTWGAVRPIQITVWIKIADVAKNIHQRISPIVTELSANGGGFRSIGRR